MTEIPGRTLWTVPNILCLIRMVGAVGLVAWAWTQHPVWFAGLYLALALTDLIDGPLARWLNQRSDIGATLDSVADVMLSASLLLGVALLRWELVQQEWPWILAGISGYLLAVGMAQWKFGRLPSYHTWSAKVSHLVVVLAGLLVVLLGWGWPLRVAALAALVTNLESLLITHSLSVWQADVPSLLALRRLQPPSEATGSRDGPG